jgi:hypothetical protein
MLSMQDEFVSRLLDAVMSGRKDFRDVWEIALRFIPQERFDFVSASLEYEAFFLSIADYSLQMPMLHEFGDPLYSDEHVRSAVLLYMSMIAQTLYDVKKREAGALSPLLFDEERHRNDLMGKLQQRAPVYFKLKFSEINIERKYHCLSEAEKVEHDELLYLPTMRKFLAACSGTDGSIDTLNPKYGQTDVGKSKEVVTRSLLCGIHAALLSAQLAIQKHVKTSGLTR